MGGYQKYDCKALGTAAAIETVYTLVLASQKGGSGKTTLAGHLAVQAELAGQGPVAVIDSDPQGSLTHWWNARKSETPHFTKVDLLTLSEALADLRAAGFRLVVFDTPPAVTSAISQVVAHADLVIVPARPSPHDLRAIGATVDIAERHDKPVIFVINGATARARITGEAAVALSQHGTVAPVILKNRVDFAASMVDGRTVGEIAPDSASAIEVRDLWTYIQSRLFRLMRDPFLRPEFEPRDQAISSLSSLDEADFDDAEKEDVSDVQDGTEEQIGTGAQPEIGDPETPSVGQPPTPDGRGYRAEPRDGRLHRRFLNGTRRRSPFGRRATD